MKNFSFKKAWLSLSLLVTFLLFSGFYLNNTPSRSHQFQILEGSQLYIEGSSNVNTFSCVCEQEFQKSTLEKALLAEGQVVQFSNTILRLQTKSLDCGQKVMNKDMYKTLKADQYPTITIQLSKAIYITAERIDQCTDWVPMTAQTYISISGVKKKMIMNLQARKCENGTYQFKAVQEFRLTDFGIEPPTALLGMVKVKDQMKIHLDLIVDVDG